MPITTEQADNIFMKTMYDGQQKTMIPNCAAVWDSLGVKWVKGELTRKEITKH